MFSQVPQADIPRSTFDRSHGYKTTFDAGKCIPFLVDEYLPGDTYNVNVQAFARLATPIYPIMDNAFLDIHFFSCANRIIWENWRKFLGEQTDPGDSTDFTIPTSTYASAALEGSIQDYMGMPTQVTGIDLIDLPLRAYYTIWNEWYRDQNLQDSVIVPTGDGPDNWGSVVPKPRNKRHDYFTSALPFPQKGDSTTAPLEGLAPVQGLGFVTGNTPTGAVTVREAARSGPIVYSNAYSAGIGLYGETASATTSIQPEIYADLATASPGIDINQLRQAFQIQRLLERDARGGTRMAELIRAHFGVRFMDVTYRPEYLGGGSIPLIVNPIASTYNDATNDTTGDLGAIGTASGRAGFTKSFTEHGWIIGIVSARADLTYQEGLPREYSRQTRYDYYWPALSHLGEQAILNKEIYADGSANDDLVFGYIGRYDEYRYKPSRITGAFRSNAAAPLDAWHLSQEFGSVPTLNSLFIEENPPFDRVIKVPAEPHFIFDSYIQMRCARPMPVYGVPGFIDRF